MRTHSLAGGHGDTTRTLRIPGIASPLDIVATGAVRGGNVLMRYQMSSDAISREIDELTWLLQYADRQLRAAEKWPAHYWALFIVLAGIGAVLTAMLINQFV
jgi:hypothetical protein